MRAVRRVLLGWLLERDPPPSAKAMGGTTHSSSLAPARDERRVVEAAGVEPASHGELTWPDYMLSQTDFLVGAIAV